MFSVKQLTVQKYLTAEDIAIMKVRGYYYRACALLYCWLSWHYNAHSWLPGRLLSVRMLVQRFSIWVKIRMIGKQSDYEQRVTPAL